MHPSNIYYVLYLNLMYMCLDIFFKLHLLFLNWDYSYIDFYHMFHIKTLSNIGRYKKYVLFVIYVLNSDLTNSE